MKRISHILYVGALWDGGTCLQRMRALQDLGYEVVPIDTQPPSVLRYERRLLYRIRRKLFGPIDLAGVNRQIVQELRNRPVDLIWLDKGLTVEADTLISAKKLQPNCVIIGYSPDDMAGRHNQTKAFLGHLKHYDCYFTTKSYNVSELKTLGCPRVKFVPKSFDPKTHRPMQLSEQEKLQLGGPVGFVGSFEKQRAGSILHLCRNQVGVRVYGEGWESHAGRHPLLRTENRPVFGDDYARAICSFDISLCFLRKLNRDLQTARSIEIPACGVFMLAERTAEHLDLFEEGKEAEFFGSDEELCEKTSFYLDRPKLRQRIANAGRDRCFRSGYRHHDRLQHIVNESNALSE